MPVQVDGDVMTVERRVVSDRASTRNRHRPQTGRGDECSCRRRAGGVCRCRRSSRCPALGRDGRPARAAGAVVLPVVLEVLLHLHPHPRQRGNRFGDAAAPDVLRVRGIAIAARIAMIATVIISSIKVNPRERVMAILSAAGGSVKIRGSGRRLSADERGRSQGKRRRRRTAIRARRTTSALSPRTRRSWRPRQRAPRCAGQPSGPVQNHEARAPARGLLVHAHQLEVGIGAERRRTHRQPGGGDDGGDPTGVRRVEQAESRPRGRPPSPCRSPPPRRAARCRARCRSRWHGRRCGRS